MQTSYFSFNQTRLNARHSKVSIFFEFSWINVDSENVYRFSVFHKRIETQFSFTKFMNGYHAVVWYEGAKSNTFYTLARIQSRCFTLCSRMTTNEKHTLNETNKKKTEPRRDYKVTEHRFHLISFKHGKYVYMFGLL